MTKKKRHCIHLKVVFNLKDRRPRYCCDYFFFKNRRGWTTCSLIGSNDKCIFYESK